MLKGSEFKCINPAGAKSSHTWDGITKTFTILMSPFHTAVQVSRKSKEGLFFFNEHVFCDKEISSIF